MDVRGDALPADWPSVIAGHLAKGRSASFQFVEREVGQSGPSRVSLAELDALSRAAAAMLQEYVRPGDRVLLFLSSGPEFLVALYGCFYAGAVAVPTSPPDPSRLARTLPRTLATIETASPRLILTSAEADADAGDELEALLQENPVTRSVPVLDAASLFGNGAGPVLRSDPNPESPILLQFTSGSEGRPKAILLTARNVFYNLAGIVSLTRAHPGDRMVSWVPPSHDLGMVMGYLLPGFVGMDSSLMRPEAFVRQPLLWLETIDRVRATLSAAPNFAFDLCARKCSEEEAESLDLTSWRLVVNGGEPVRLATIERFSSKFARAGFREEVFWPSYGLAEACATVTGGRPEAAPIVRRLEPRALESGEVVPVSEMGTPHRAVVGCGRTLPGQTLVIVDPESRVPCPDGTVGEIWLSGPSVASGYWESDEETSRTFGQQMGEAGSFLRTGDLGFLEGDELFVTGRLKDLIIVRGRNHYPQDIEATLEAAGGTNVRAGCSAAFPTELEDEERLAVATEVGLTPSDASFAKAAESLGSRLCEEVAAVHGILPAFIALLEPRSIPKTSSGKVQRRETGRALREGRLTPLYLYRPPPADGSAPETSPMASSPKLSRETVESFLVEQVAALTGLGHDNVDPDRPLTALGLDSLRTLQLLESLERWSGRAVARTIPWERPSISLIAEHLAEEVPSPSRSLGRTMEVPSGATENAIAIVGMACRLPGATDLDGFWRLLREGRDAIRELPSERFDAKVFHGTPSGARFGGTLDQIDGFDAPLFRVSPREATHLDPQQRLFLELGWEALEDGGQAPDSLSGSDTGVFVGVYQNDYLELQGGDPGQMGEYYGTGILLSIVANRLSYALGLEGPSLVVDTACSSSLTAVHLACQAIRSGDCSLAIAGGVSLMLSPGPMLFFSRLQTLAPDGRCKAFSTRADGFVRSEGGAAVLLKPLSHALADGNHVYAVLRGSAVNHGGRSNGLMAPSPEAQKKLIRKALHRAAVEPAEIGYLEAHGTGTALGDPIELQAIRTELLEKRDGSSLMALGSVKGNIGHLEAAAGIAGLVKVALMLDRKEIVPHLHGKPTISELDGLPCRLPDEAVPWTSNGRRVAGVSSFGLGGANAHIVLSEAQPRPRMPSGAPGAFSPLAFFLAARTEPALKCLAGRVAEAIEKRPEESRAIAATLLSGRAHLANRLALVAGSPTEAAFDLRAFTESELPSSSYAVVQRDRTEWARRPVFVVPGACPRPAWTAIAPWWSTDPIAADVLSELGNPTGREENEDRLGLILSLCLHRVFVAAGLAPTHVVAYGSGEITARCLLGQLSPREAWRRLDGGRGGAVRARVFELGPSGRQREPGSAESTLHDRLVLVLGVQAPGLAVEKSTNTTVIALAAASEAPLSEACRRLYLEGARADWRRLLAADVKMAAGTPTYPFERKRYWTQSPRALRNYYPSENTP